MQQLTDKQKIKKKSDESFNGFINIFAEIGNAFQQFIKDIHPVLMNIEKEINQKIKK